MAIYERDGYGTICYEPEYYTKLIGAARRMHTMSITRAAYYRKSNARFSNREAAIELGMAAIYRQSILSNKRDREYAIAKKVNGNWIGCGHDPSGNEY